MALSGTAPVDELHLKLSGDYYRALVSGERRGLWPGLQRLGLWAASWPYGWGIYWRNRLYDRSWKRVWRAPVRVVSVGNLTLGGTGKTPCVEYVARFFKQRGRRVAILSRGYGGEQGLNDEALVLADNLPDVPHLQGADRVALAQTAVERLKSEVLVLDDGFQHRRLARDLDIVLLDATQPWGYGYLFPRGLLREWPAELRRAGMVVLTRSDQVDAAVRGRLREAVMRFAGDVPWVETVHRPVDLVNSDRKSASLQELKDRPVAAFCGIGNPEAFRRTLLNLGADVAVFRAFPDHHRYQRTDVEALEDLARGQASRCVLLTTQKDLVKLRLTQLGSKDLWALRISLQVEAGQDILDRKLGELN